MNYSKFVIDHDKRINGVGAGTIRNKFDLEDLLRSKCNTQTNNVENTASEIESTSNDNSMETFISKKIFGSKNKKEKKKSNITNVANISAYNDSHDYTDF